jgi:long-chain acyl-CoA synthetase
VKEEKDSKVKIIKFEDLEKIGKENKTESEKPTKDDVAVLMYTSGSTGTPKGKMNES